MTALVSLTCRLANLASIGRVVNEVARNISKDLPELLIYTLAYADTQKPPTVTKPEDNVSASV